MLKPPRGRASKKVALINPLAESYNPCRSYVSIFSKLKVGVGSNLFLSPTILLLATLLRRMGCSVEIINDIEEKIDPGRIDADTIFITIMTPTAKRGYQIAGMFPDRKTVLGGVHATILPDEAALHADHVVVGEVEEVLQDLVSGELTETIIHGAPLDDLDRIPPIDFEVLGGVPEMLPIQTSRGCPYDCTFCSVTQIFGKKYRFRSAENVLGELIRHRDLYGGIRKIDFTLDANFTHNRKRAKEILKGMLRENIVPQLVTADARMDIARDRELLSLMSRFNIILYMGIESLDDEVLASYRKGQKVADIVEGLKIIHDHNIQVHGYFIFGADQDSESTLSSYADFIDATGLDFFDVSIMTPYPGTELFERLDAQGRIFTKDWNFYDGFHVTYLPAKMTPFDMQKAYNDFYKATFSWKSCLKPGTLLKGEVRRHRFLMSLLTKILRRSGNEYLEKLRRMHVTV